jgi:hypothetical protein
MKRKVGNLQLLGESLSAYNCNTVYTILQQFRFSLPCGRDIAAPPSLNQ